MCSSDLGARRSRKPIWVLSSAQAGDSMCLHDKHDLARALATERAAQEAYRQAGLGPGDVDVVELHDCFTIAELLEYEAMGLTPRGQGARAVLDGWTHRDGRLPVNPSGGLKAKGHPIGATGCILTVKALYELQRTQARRALVSMCIGGGQGIAAVFERL